MNKTSNNLVNVKITRSKSREELANEYGVSPRTFRRWLKKNNIILPRGLVKPRDIQNIYNRLGRPSDTLR